MNKEKETTKDGEFKPASKHLKDLTKFSQEYGLYDINLPEVEDAKAAKPRVHVSDSVCESCEG